MKRSRLFLLSLFTTILFLSVVQVGISNKLSTTGIELEKIQKTLKTYKAENALLSEEFLTMSSFTHVAKAAEDAGFTDKRISFFLTAPLPIARQR